ncbi:hypothetical protein IGB00_34835 [Pseudomonas aeruginosa]|nr:hypothetical protein [Pseudomonas aeruginosa]
MTDEQVPEGRKILKGLGINGCDSACANVFAAVERAKKLKRKSKSKRKTQNLRVVTVITGKE